MKERTTVTIRPFTPTDYKALVQVMNTAFPEYPYTTEELRHEDETRNPALYWQRWLAETNGQAVGFIHAAQAHVDDAQKFGIDAAILPDWRGQGVGKALYNHLESAVLPRSPRLLRTHARETEMRARQFLQDRGFVEVQREQESKLDLVAWQPELWHSEREAAAQRGIQLRTYRELADGTSDLAELHRQMDDLHWALKQDIPSSEPPTRDPHEDFIKRFDRPDFLPDGNVFALDGHQLVGKSVLWYAAASNELFTGTTGVLRSHRQRGIATALKIAALTYGKSRGATAVRTFNEVNNRGMLGINRRLGFEYLPAWIEYRKTFDEKTNAD